MITDKSLAPINENCKVLGIGVAVRVKVSMFDLKVFNLSLIETPNFCSSSITSSPISLNFTSLPTILCVPIKISTSPFSTFLRISFCSLAVLNLLMYSTVHGSPSSLLLNDFACCIAKIVVGTNMATCLLSATALKAALIAISVFPKPTSPHTNLSIGIVFSISCLTAIVVFN